MANPVCALVQAGEGLGRTLAKTFAAEGCDVRISASRLKADITV